MRTRATTTMTAAAVLLAVLTGCGDDGEKKGDAAACKAAVLKVMEDAGEGRMPTGDKRPGSCEGLSEKELQDLSADAVKEYTKKKTEELTKDLDGLGEDATDAVDKELDDALKDLEDAGAQ
ncbi:hypothetical protein ABT354_34420 [Streptomyces sp. NPDC000594]|uniref:hypothetical protein n=1 Tax=Streptomyces sp. NPDC000594 TaxID=3154261 RepID=UPI0033178A6A